MDSSQQKSGKQRNSGRTMFGELSAGHGEGWRKPKLKVEVPYRKKKE